MSYSKMTKAQLVEELERLGSGEDSFGRSKAKNEGELQAVEGRYRALIEGMNEGVVVVDNDDVIQFVNGRFCDMFGYKKEDLTGKVAHKLFLSKEDQKVIKEKHRFRRQGRSDRYEIKMKRKSEGSLWTQISAAPIADLNGQIIGSFGIITDITDQKHAQEALKRSEDRFRHLVDHAADAFFVVNPEGRFIDVNQWACDSLGYTREELLGLSVWDIDESWDSKKSKDFLEQLASGAIVAPVSVEGIHRRKDGTTFPIEVRIGLLESAGRPLALALARDLTDRRKAEEHERRRWQLELENAYLREEVQSELTFGEIVGKSEALCKVIRQVEMVAPTDASVPIQGESGTGKELIARAIHNRSMRSHKTMVKVNCSAIPRDLFESEFFGHVKGAFTGALKDRIGRFELADGGTLFLDEVSGIPIELQAKLLRVLQEGQFEKVGEGRTRQVNVRIIAATNRDLKGEVQAGRFREDLYYRLSVFPIEVPPLRERKVDIPLLAAHFIDSASRRFNCPNLKLMPEHIRQLQRYDWPGNVRELQNVIERAVIISRCGSLRLDLAFFDTALNEKPGLTPDESVDSDSSHNFIPEAEFKRRERDNILAALRAANGKVFGLGGAAELLGVKPTTLASRMKKMGKGEVKD